MFYDNFKKLCELNGEKPTPVAQKLGCSSAHVAKWKRGATPRQAMLEKMAEYFGVTVQELLFGENEKELTSNGDKLNPDYVKLNAANRAAIDAAIAALLKAQQQED